MSDFSLILVQGRFNNKCVPPEFDISLADEEYCVKMVCNPMLEGT
jgi:hypothetical protein